MLDNLYNGMVIHEGYPRNSIFFSGESGDKLKKRLGYEGQQLIMYMPTFRGRQIKLKWKGLKARYISICVNLTADFQMNRLY